MFFFSALRAQFDLKKKKGGGGGGGGCSSPGSATDFYYCCSDLQDGQDHFGQGKKAST